jgi:hypothetical protein
VRKFMVLLVGATMAALMLAVAGVAWAEGAPLHQEEAKGR